MILPAFKNLWDFMNHYELWNTSKIMNLNVDGIGSYCVERWGPNGSSYKIIIISTAYPNWRYPRM